MNPVVGLDVSSGESEIQAFLDKGKPYEKSFKVSHTKEVTSGLLCQICPNFCVTRHSKTLSK